MGYECVYIVTSCELSYNHACLSSLSLGHVMMSHYNNPIPLTRPIGLHIINRTDTVGGNISDFALRKRKMELGWK